MNVNLGPVFDRFIADLLHIGQYQSQSEVVREGLRLLKQREDQRQARLVEIRRAIGMGMEQADRGEFVAGPAAFAKIRQRSAKRKCASR